MFKELLSVTQFYCPKKGTKSFVMKVIYFHCKWWAFLSAVLQKLN